MKHHLLSLTSPKFTRDMEGIQNQHQKNHQIKEKDSVKTSGACQHLRSYPNKAAIVLGNSGLQREQGPLLTGTWQPCLGDQLDFKRDRKLRRLLSEPDSKPVAVSWVQLQSPEQMCLLQFSLPPKGLLPACPYSQARRLLVTLSPPSVTISVCGATEPHGGNSKFPSLGLSVRTACPERARGASRPTTTASSSLVSVQEASRGCQPLRMFPAQNITP